MDTTPRFSCSYRGIIKSNIFTLNYPFIFEINRFYAYFPYGCTPFPVEAGDRAGKREIGGWNRLLLGWGGCGSGKVVYGGPGRAVPSGMKSLPVMNNGVSRANVERMT